jgi:pimeloyl-ACP methyl ester carboxylesterase
MWAPQLAFADRFRVIAPDLFGFGESGLPAGGWTVDSMADAVAESLTGIGVTEPVALGGLSMGGYVALAFARRHPDRLKALILADTKAEPDTEEGKKGRAAMIETARSGGGTAVADKMLPNLLGRSTHERRPEVASEVRRLASEQSVEGIVAGLVALRDRPDARPGLGNIRVPTLVLVGAEDKVTPPDAGKAMADAIPGATYQVLPAAGHLSNLEAPSEFNTAVRMFLAGA